MYFDGTGDYVSVPASANLALGTGDFTIECWVYPLAATIGALLDIYDANSVGRLLMQIETALTVTLRGPSAAVKMTSTSKLLLNAWNHLALVRSSGVDKLFFNGVQDATTLTDATNYTFSSTIATVGILANNLTQSPLNGYLSNFRIVKGTPVYTAGFSIPVAPLTAVTNTQLLLSGTNANIVDAAAKCDVETLGSAQTSTAVKKFNPSSIKFNGTTDYLYQLGNPNLVLPGDFTIECWIYVTALPGSASASGIIALGPLSGGSAIRLVGTTNKIQYWLNGNGNIVNGVTAIQTNTWYHLALVRSGTAANNISLYINGIREIQSSSNYAIPFNPTVVGRSYTDQNTEYLAGYVDDIRINKSALYKGNFTAPTAALTI
jgi:hypothetical protein